MKYKDLKGGGIDIWFECIKQYQLARLSNERFNTFATKKSLPTLSALLDKINAKCDIFEQYTLDPQKASEKTLVDFYNDMLVLLDRLFMLAVGIKASITNFILSVQDPRTHTKQTECKHKLEQILMDFRGDEKVDAIFEQILKRYDKYIS